MYSLDTPENMGKEKIILTQKKKDARKSGNNRAKSPTRTWTIIHKVQILMQI